MATTTRVVYGKDGDEVIITRTDLGYGDEYLVEHRVGAGYLTVYSTFSYEKALQKVEQINPHF